MLPRMYHGINDGINSDAISNLCKHKRASASHGETVTFHNTKVSTNSPCEIGFIDDEKVGLGNARTSFSGDFVATSNVNNIDAEVSQFATEVSGEIVATRLDQKQISLKSGMELLQRKKIGGNVLAYCCVRAAASLNGADSLGFEGTMANQKLAVLFGENVVGHCGNVHFVSKFLAQRQHEGGFAAAHGPADADGKGAVSEVSGQRPGAFVKMPRAVQVFVRVAVTRVVQKVVGIHGHGSALKEP